MDVVVNIRPYLEHLKQIESTVPGDIRLKVPSQGELAKVAGMHGSPFGRVLNNQTDKIDRHVLARIIGHLRGCGFDCDVGDLLTYINE